VFPANLDLLVQSIVNGSAYGGCDGSYMPELSRSLGAAAWKLEDPMSRQAVEGTVQTSGHQADVNAYRSELQGIHTLLLALSAVCSFYQITHGAVTLGCDNKGAVHQSNGDWLKVSQTTRHADLIRAIRRLKDRLPIPVTIIHIYGHQDQTAAYQTLPCRAQLNIEMDIKAKTHLRSLISANSSPLLVAPLQGEGWQCMIDGVKLSSHPAPAVYKSAASKQLRKHLHSKHILTFDAFPDVDWEALELATSHFPPPSLSPVDVQARQWLLWMW
jgi:hypothetical protein